MNYVDCAATDHGVENRKIREKKPHLCSNQKDDIFLMCDITISHDISDKHSTTICKKCHFKVRTIKLKKKQRNEFKPILSVNDCSVCAHHRSFSSGGRRKTPILSSPTDSADFDDASGGGSSPAALNNGHPTSPAVVTKTPEKTAKTSLSEDTTTSIETINMEKQDQHTRSKHQIPQNTDTAVATEKPPTPQKNTYIEIQEQNMDSISLSDFNTPQPLASSTPKMIDSTTSPIDKQYTTF